MKKIILSYILFAGILCTAHAADYIRLNNEDIDEYCMQMTETLTVSVDPVWQSTLLSHRWVLLGDLKMANGYSATDHTIQVVCPQNGYGKGRITYRYSTTGCSTSESIDIYKLFTPPADLEIEGPRCVEAGDVVVYSIEPVLTVNLDDQIGMDHYYWNINDTTHRPYFVDSVYYTAGDGSSVTFKIKELNDDSVNTISLYLGQCNNGDATKKITLPLVKQAPKPQLDTTDFYQSYGQARVRIGIKNIQPNVHYSWSKINDWSIVETNSDSTYVVLQLDDNSGGDVIVSARYADSQEDCATTQTRLHIYRRWGDNIEIEGATCLTAGQTYSFSVKGEIPEGAEVRWEFPSNKWTHANDVSQRIITAVPSLSIGLTDSIRVYEVLSTDTLTPKYKTFKVNIKPAKVYIDGNTCVTANTTQTYMARRASDAVGPDATRYEWRVNNEVMPYENETLYYTAPMYGSQIISVKPLGEGTCNADTASLSISVSPTAPNGIVRVDNTHCIAKGMNDEIILELDGASSEQTYAWNFDHTHNWQRLAGYDPNGNSSKIKVVTTGQAGRDTVIAYAVGTTGCANTVPDSIFFTTADVPFELFIEERNSWYDIYIIPTDLSQIEEFANANLIEIRWYYDGILEEDDNDMPDTSIRRRDYSNTSTIDAIVTIDSNCKYSFHTTIGELLSASQNMTPELIPMKRRLETEENTPSKIKLYPNPVNDILTVELPGEETRSIMRIYDMTGNMVLRKESFNTDIEKIDVTSFPEGIYVLKINQGFSRIVNTFSVKH